MELPFNTINILHIADGMWIVPAYANPLASASLWSHDKPTTNSPSVSIQTWTEWNCKLSIHDYREERKKKKAASKTTTCITMGYDNQLPTTVAWRRDHLLWNPVTFAIITLQITSSPTLAACMRSSTSAQLAEQYHQLWRNQVGHYSVHNKQQSPLPAHPFSWLWEEKTFSIR